MRTYEYYECRITKLQEELDNRAQDGWVLHTAQFVGGSVELIWVKAVPATAANDVEALIENADRKFVAGREIQ